MEVINVNLYGGKSIFGGRETPQRAETIYCDRFNECSYFKSGCCLNVTAPFSNRCKYGNIRVEHGYTSRARKHYDFDSKHRKSEQYAKLKHPPQKLGLIGNEVVFSYPFIRITKTETGNIKLDDPGFGSSIAYIENELFTIDLIKRICGFRPYAIMGGVITDYQNKIVPLFLAHLKEVMPDKYEELGKENQELIKEVNYVGRKALLKTIAPSDIFYESSSYPQFNEKWYWDGEFLTYSSGHVSSFNITKNYAIAEIKITPSDKSIITISSNEQVTNETVFID